MEGGGEGSWVKCDSVSALLITSVSQVFVLAVDSDVCAQLFG